MTIESMAKKILERKELLKEYKGIASKHKNGEYLAKISEEEIKEREAAKEARKKELEEVEKALRDKQVKFLATEEEYDELKKAARLAHTTQSEFIRSAIWEKIESVTGQKKEKTLEDIKAEESVKYHEELKVELQAIKSRLKPLTSLERKGLRRLANLELQERIIADDLKEIKKRITKLEK